MPNRSDTPMDTESNINVEEHQESPIDEVNETTKMKHIDTALSQTFICESCVKK